MFNFRHLNGDNCDGCNMVPSVAVVGDSYRFDGSGYVSMPQVHRYNDQVFSVRMEVRTFWSDALLFWSFNKHNGDYLSLAIDNGNIVFRVSLEGRRTFELRTLSRYNNNNWVTTRRQLTCNIHSRMPIFTTSR